MKKDVTVSITKQNSSEQKRLLHLVARLDEDSRIEIFDKQKTIFHKLKSDYIEIENKKLTYCSFIMSVKEFENKIDSDRLKTIKFENQYKRIDLSEKLSTVASVILNLRDKENFTFRDITKYLKKNHRINVVHSTIYNFYNSIKKENNFE